MASIREDVHGFQVRWRDPDGRDRSRRKGFGLKDQSRRQAHKRARAFLAEVQRLEDQGERWVHPRHLHVPSLSDALHEYLSDYARSHAKSSTRHAALRLRAFERFVLERDRHAYLDVLDRRLVAAWYEHLASSPRRAGRALLEDKRRSATTLEKYVRTVEAFWLWCWDQDELAEWVPRVRRLDLPAAEHRATRAPTWAEMDACVDAFKPRKKDDERPWQWRVAVVMRFTGLRVGQVMGLEWADFDLDAGLLYFPGRLGKTAFEKLGRVVPLSPHLVTHLAAWGQRDGWLIESGRAAGVREREFRSRDMARAWRRAGVRPEVWQQRPDHAFRKGFTSELKRAGADPEAAEYLVGRRLGGERGTYIDPSVLPLREAVGLIPRLGGSGVALLSSSG